MPWIKLRKTDLAYFIALLFVSMMAWTSISSSKAVLDTTNARLESARIRFHLDTFLTRMNEAETGQRGYLLTGSEPYLRPFQEAEGSYSSDLELLRADHRHDSDQLRRFEHLKVLTEEKFAIMSETIRLKKRGDSTAAVALVRKGKGKDLMDQIRATLGELLAIQETEWEAKIAAADATIKNGDSIAEISSLAALLLVLLAWSYSRIQENKREAAETGLNQFFSVALDMLCIIGSDGFFKKLNPTFEKNLGFLMDELYSRPFCDFLHPDDLEKTKSTLEKIAKGAGLFAFENRLRCKDGTYRWFEWKAAPVGSGIFASARDMTQQRQSMIDIQLEAERNSSIIGLQYEVAAGGTDVDHLMNLVVARAERLTHAAGASIEMTEGDEMVCRAASGHAASSLGSRSNRSSSLSGKCANVGEVLLWRDSETDHRGDHEKGDRIGSRSMVFVPLKHHGRVIGVLNVYSHLPDAFSDRHRATLELMSGFLGIMLDRASSAEAIKKAENELRTLNAELENQVSVRTHELEESQARFRMVADNIDAILWMSTADRKKILYVNPAYERFSGKTCQSLLANPMSMTDFIHPDDVEKVLAIVSQKQTEGHDLQYRYKRADGEIRWARSMSYPTKDTKGEVDRIVGVLTDITDLRKANEAEMAATDASKMKSEFLANMSHEIRTPINGVMGMANILLDTPMSDEQKDYTQNIIRSADTLLTLVNDILDLSKAEAGKIDLELIDFSIEQVLNDVERTLNYAARKKNLEFLTKVDSALPRFFQGDPTRLLQILMNLANNAIKFTQTGHVKVTVSGNPIGGGQYLLHFDVVDTGIGIPESALSRMFQAFHQADSSTTRRFGGTGLGLSISKNLVELMNGKIGVKSVEGQGTNFWFSLTLETAKAEVVTSKSDSAVVSANPLKLRILLAEDNSVNQLIAIKMLKNLGHSVTAVAGGNEVIDALEAASYDLILMDCQMPGMDGYDTTHVIRNSPTLDCREIAIIAMTANAMAGDREKCLAVGMNDYVSKPVKVNDLQRVIERTLHSYKLAS